MVVGLVFGLVVRLQIVVVKLIMREQEEHNPTLNSLGKYNDSER